MDGIRVGPGEKRGKALFLLLILGLMLILAARQRENIAFSAGFLEALAEDIRQEENPWGAVFCREGIFGTG